MLHSDLEEVTSLQLRKKVEEVMKMDLKEYKGFLDQQMLMILGQLEKPSQIHEYLYLACDNT
jgi:protein phosphatase slingshot